MRHSLKVSTLISVLRDLMGKRELVALLNLSSWCLVTVERLFLAVPRGCLQFVIVVFPDQSHYYLLDCTEEKCLLYNFNSNSRISLCVKAHFLIYAEDKHQSHQIALFWISKSL